VVACAAGDNAFGLFLFAEHGDLIAGAPELEGAGALKVFGLEIQGKILGEAIGSGQRSGTDNVLQNQRSMENLINGQHIFISFQKGFVFYPENYTIEWKQSQAKAADIVCRLGYTIT
jgi:hypothetical protein